MFVREEEESHSRLSCVLQRLSHQCWEPPTTPRASSLKELGLWFLLGGSGMGVGGRGTSCLVLSRGPRAPARAADGKQFSALEAGGAGSLCPCLSRLRDAWRDAFSAPRWSWWTLSWGHAGLGSSATGSPSALGASLDSFIPRLGFQKVLEWSSLLFLLFLGVSSASSPAL